MRELIVVTYKLPADPLTRKIYGDDLENVYDCQAFWNDELSKPEIKKLERKYSEVESFVCEFAAYNDWIDNESAWADFVKTGNCPLKPVQEDVEVGVNSRTVTIECPVRIQRENADASFDYKVDIDEVGQIVFTPYDVGTRFCHSGEDVVEDENVKIETVKLTAQMLSDSDNYDYFMGTDDVGQFVITPDVEESSFLTVSVDDSLNLVTEEVGGIIVDPDYVPEFNIGDRVVAHINGNDRPGELVDFVDQDPMDAETGCDSGDFSAWIVRFDDSTQEMIGQCYLTKENKITECGDTDSMKILKESNRYRDFEWTDELYAVIKNDGTYAGVPCRSYSEASQLAYHPGSKIFKLVLEDEATEEPLEEALDELDRSKIIHKIMIGELPVYEEEGTPTETMIHLPELTNTHGPMEFNYYYDEESESVVSFRTRVSEDHE